MTVSPADNVTKALRDAAYIGIGLGVIVLQKAQVQRQELQKQLRGQLGDAREQLEKLGDTFEDQVRLIEARLDAVEDQVEDLIGQVEGRLPEQAAHLVKQIRAATKDARGQVRTLVARNGRAA